MLPVTREFSAYTNIWEDGHPTYKVLYHTVTGGTLTSHSTILIHWPPEGTGVHGEIRGTQS